MRKVALAIIGLLVALGSEAHGKTVPAQGPAPWCEGHPQVPTGNAVTASAGVEQGESAIGVFACFEVVASGSRPTSGGMHRLWFDPDDGVGAVECVPHKNARLAPRCYRQLDAPADHERKKAEDERRRADRELEQGGRPAPDGPSPEGIGVEMQTPTPCPAVPGDSPAPCVDSHRVAAQADTDSEAAAHAILDEKEACIGACGGGR